VAGKAQSTIPAPLLAFNRDRSNGAVLLSVVAPMRDEEGGAYQLVEETAEALSGVVFEFIAVDDASRDATLAELQRAQTAGLPVRVLAHEKNAGQSRAVRTGVLAARGPVIATIDGDGQNVPTDIMALYQRLMRQDAPPLLAMVAGERRERLDAAAKKRASWLANWARRRILGDGAADSGCGLKVFYRDAFLRLPYFDHIHRYLPALMLREGYLVEFTGVAHRPRAHGSSKYTNLGRLGVAFRDLFGVVWLKARARSPIAISELVPGEGCGMEKTEAGSAGAIAKHKG